MDGQYSHFLTRTSPPDWESTPESVKNLISELQAWVKQHQASLETNSRLTQFLEALPVGVAVHDAGGNLIYINRIGKSLLGLDRPVPIAADYLPVTFQIYCTSTQSLYPAKALPSSRALAGESIYASDLAIYQIDRMIPLEVWATPIFDEAGGIPYAISAFQDISDRQRHEIDRKQAAEALQRSEARLRQITNAIPGAVYQFRVCADGRHEFLFMSEGIRDLCELSPEAVIQDAQTMWALVLPEDLAQLHTSIDTSALTLSAWNLEFQIRTPSGQRKWILGQSLPRRHESEGTVWDGILMDISERKQSEAERLQAEIALQQSEARFRNMAANVPGAIFRYVLHPDGSNGVLYMSPGCYGLWEVDAAAVVEDGTVLWEMVHPEDLPDMVESVRVSAQTLEPWYWEWRIITPSGQRKWLQAAGRPERQPNGDIIWDSLILDVSDRKRAEERFQNLAANTPGVIYQYLLRPDGSDAMLYISPVCRSLWEVEPQVIEENVAILWQMVLPEDYLSLQRSIQESAQTLQPWNQEWRITSPSGQQKWLHGSAKPTAQANGEVIWDGVILDISDRKRAEAALRDSEERYRLLAENMNDLVCLHHADGRYLYISPSCETILGYAPGELLNQNPYDFFHPDDRDRIYEESHRTALAGNPVPITYRTRQKSGNYIWLETLTKPIRDASGQIIRLQTTSRDVTERVKAQEQLRYDALHDALTGLPNRHLLMERLELAIHRAQRFADHYFAILFLDLDRFKVINDSLGHIAGDQLIVAIAHKLQALLRTTDLAARLGGDEFVILLEGIKGIQEAIRVTERIFTELQAPLIIEGRSVFTTTSIGIVFGTQAYERASDLLRDADIAMYRAKAKGKARYEIFDIEMHRQALKRLHLENDLRHAIEQREFVVYYQPIVAIETGLLSGFEALVRWQHPTQGLIAPGDFIPVAEETGLILALDRWLMQAACHQLAEWRDRFPNLPHLKISVNLSVQDLWQPNLVAIVDQILAETHLDGQHLTLEITESMLIENIGSTSQLLAHLKQRGIQISIDDFGTGYSSLSYLHRLPVDFLKIDRSFVHQMQESSKNQQIVKTIVTLSNELGLKAVAEGIETAEQLSHLQQLGYEFGQGYFFARPLCAIAATELLQRPQIFTP